MSLPPPIWIPSNAAYHSERVHWSASRLACFRESPALAYGRYVSGEYKGPDSTLEMRRGSLVNLLLLEADRWEREVYVVDVDGRNAKAFTSAEATYTDRFVVTRKEAEEARAVANAILRPRTRMAEVAKVLLCEGEGWSEYAHRWKDSSGVPCKSKMDRVISLNRRVTIVELKSSRDPSPVAFEKQFYEMEYNLQAAFNCRGGEVAFGERPLFIVVAVRNVPPYDAWVYNVDTEYLEDAAEEVEDSLQELAKRLAGLEPWCSRQEMLLSDQLPALRAPRYVARKRKHQAVTVFDSY